MANGTPVSGATVRLEPMWSPLPVPQEQRTSADGRFDFGEQPAARYTVSASAPGHSGASLPIHLADPRLRPDSLMLQLADCGARLHGTVTDSAGGPLAHARVHPVAATGAESDSEGRYVLCLPLGSVDVQVEASGYGGMQERVIALGDTERDFSLIPGGFIVGQVLDEDDAPVAGAQVMALPPVADFRRVLSGGAVSDAQGGFRMGVAPGRYSVWARTGRLSTAVPAEVAVFTGLDSPVRLRVDAKLGVLRGRVRADGKPVAGAEVVVTVDGQRAAVALSQDDGRFVAFVPRGLASFSAAPWDVVSPRDLRIAADDETVELEVRPLASVHGIVTRLGKPVAGAEVLATSSGTARAMADAEGRYRLDGLQPGTWRVRASSEAAGACTYSGTRVTLSAGDDVRADVELELAATISGVVVDEQGAPVRGVMVEYRQRDSDFGRGGTDAQGRFTCTAMSGGGDYVARVFPPSWSNPFRAARPFPVVKLADGRSQVEGVRLVIANERLRISGRVVDANGESVSDARLSVSGTAAATGGLPASGVSNQDGAFTIAGLTPGTYVVSARSPEGGEGTMKDVAAGTSDLEVQIPASSAIEGELVGFTERPAVFAQPMGSPARLIPARVEGGRFTIRLPPGTYQVMAQGKHEGDSRRVELRQAETVRTRLTSHGTAAVFGTVIEHTSRRPLPGMRCAVAVRGDAQLAGWTSPPEVSVTDLTGAFSFDSAPAGSVTVHCLDDSGDVSLTSAELTVAAGERAEVRLEAARRLAGASGDIGVTLEPLRIQPLVVAVRPGGPAASVGLMPGDVITAVDGAPTGALTADGVRVLLANHVPGERIALTITRATGESLTVSPGVE